ncbi:hypothetical protein Dsin_005652 [Dipteronia sinensis]|uniref:UBN2_2 domain-containing protein n=1 Tax=Dipteronia sinensis TaxID=43782 RepID=A0AAE0EGP8_9ROSI|nr:hypothetical protein Dsin_005652 [Dipteronia sinensis]
MTVEVASQIMGYQSSQALWKVIKDIFSAHSSMLQQTREGSLKMLDYVNSMKSFDDNLTFAGNPVPVRQLVYQIMAGLDEEYTLIAVMIQSKSEITWFGFQAELLTYEKRMEQLFAIKGGVTINQATTNLVSSRTRNFNSRVYGHFPGQSHGR